MFVAMKSSNVTNDTCKSSGGHILKATCFNLPAHGQVNSQVPRDTCGGFGGGGGEGKAAGK
jgi:hypothetical protein